LLSIELVIEREQSKEDRCNTVCIPSLGISPSCSSGEYETLLEFAHRIVSAHGFWKACSMRNRSAVQEVVKRRYHVDGEVKEVFTVQYSGQNHCRYLSLFGLSPSLPSPVIELNPSLFPIPSSSPTTYLLPFPAIVTSSAGHPFQLYHEPLGRLLVPPSRAVRYATCLLCNTKMKQKRSKQK
jgi:hypothetical protein